MICFFYSARASPSWSSANLLTTCFSVLLKSNGSHHGKATICPKMFFPFPEIRGIIRVSYASFLIPAKNFAVFWVKFAITIYPRKGTETHWLCVTKDDRDPITIYPRKGTETFLILTKDFQVGHYNLSPQGDGNLSGNTLNQIHHITIYPRKGTETMLILICRVSRWNYNLSPQGDKKAPLPLAFASSGGALLFLIFYFTGWELCLPESSL